MKSKKTIVLFLIFLFLAVLIVLGSVLFSVKNVEGYCYNSDDNVVREQVVDEEVHGIASGTNIFMLNENKIRQRIEDRIPNVKVINIERKFPSSIYINYIIIEEYFVIETDDEYLYISNDCKVLRKSNKDAVDNTSQENGQKYIKLIGGENFNSLQVGDLIFSQASQKFSILSEFMLAISRLGYQKEIVEILDTVDLRFLDQNLLYAKTVPGIEIEIQQPTSALTTKVQYAFSRIDSLDDVQRKTGTVILYNQGNKVLGAYSTSDKYTQKLEELKNR